MRRNILLQQRPPPLDVLSEAGFDGEEECLVRSGAPGGKLLQRWLELHWSRVELIGHKDELREHAGARLRHRVVLDRVQHAAVRFAEALPR